MNECFLSLEYDQSLDYGSMGWNRLMPLTLIHKPFKYTLIRTTHITLAQSWAIRCAPSCENLWSSKDGYTEPRTNPTAQLCTYILSSTRRLIQHNSCRKPVSRLPASDIAIFLGRTERERVENTRDTLGKRVLAANYV